MATFNGKMLLIAISTILILLQHIFGAEDDLRIFMNQHMRRMHRERNLFWGRLPSIFLAFPGSRCSRLICDWRYRYRTADGSCNNLWFPLQGTSQRPLKRFLPPVYEDGVSEPRGGNSTTFGARARRLPPARRVSFNIHEVPEKNVNHDKYTIMVMQFGQFVDHDMAHTPNLKDGEGKKAKCCADDFRTASKANLQRELNARAECFPIPVDTNDPHFKNRTCLHFARSQHADPGGSCTPDTGSREQTSKLTAYIDGSMIYGSTVGGQRQMRLMEGGMLRHGAGDMLPFSHTKVDGCQVPDGANYTCFDAGDDRVNEQVGLTALHTMWLRQHNKMATELSKLNPEWNDEIIFQETRRIIGAMMQHITFNEYLPTVIGPQLMKLYCLGPKDSGYTSSYKYYADATIANVVSTAAFRYGHSMIPTSIQRLGGDYTEHNYEPLKFVNAFKKPAALFDWRNGGLYGLARGLVMSPVQDSSNKLNDQVTRHLFEDSHGRSLDLASLNIQRGREHGLPGYNAWRRWCGLTTYRMFDEMTDIPNVDIRNRLRQLYRHPDDIDIFTAGLCERKLPGAVVGPTFGCILAEQFHDLKFGDRFWYEEGIPFTRFSLDQLRELKKTSLAKVMCSNAYLDTIQPNVFYYPDTIEGNERVNCTSLPTIDLTKWKAKGWMSRVP